MGDRQPCWQYKILDTLNAKFDMEICAVPIVFINLKIVRAQMLTTRAQG